MEYLSETQREWCSGQAAGDVVIIFEFGHQGDVLLDKNSEKTGILAISEEL